MKLFLVFHRLGVPIKSVFMLRKLTEDVGV